MNEELNNLAFDNTKVAFTGKTNNIATSDELEASYLYQDKLGTNYSRSKMALKVFNFTGISLILTAAAIKTGSLISNAYILNPPSISNEAYMVEDNTFKAQFTVSNPNDYTVMAYFRVNNMEVLSEDCSEPQEYLIEYGGLKINDDCTFYIKFTNGVDYVKTIEKYHFIVEA